MQRLSQTPLEQFTVGCLVARDHCDTDRLRELYESISDDELVFDFARKNRATSTIGSRLVQLYGADAVTTQWHDAIADVGSTIQEYMDETDRVATLLATEGISLIALKNSGITRGLYRYPAESPMGDVDVLVSRGRIRDAHKLLTEDGYRLGLQSTASGQDGELEAMLAEGGTEYGKELPSGKNLWFEVQWRPVSGRWIQPDQEPDGDELIARSVAIEGSDIRLLAPLDNLIQVCLHTAKHTYVRAPGLRLHTDVDRIVRYNKIDWPAFTMKARELHVTTAVYFSLAIPEALMGTPIPAAVLPAQRPPHWKREFMANSLRRAGLFDADAPKFNRAEYILFVAMLYESIEELGRGMLPSYEQMADRYQITSKAQLPGAWGRRLVDLTWRRGKT